MAHRREANRDFAASVPFATLIDEGPGSSSPPKLPPADQAAATKALNELERKTGFRPPTEEDQRPLPPVQIYHGDDWKEPQSPSQPQTKTYKSKPIQPPLLQREDPDPALAIAHDPSQRAKAQRSDAGHEETLRHRQWREDNHLPKTAPPWSELLTQFSHLTPKQISFLQEGHFHPERFKKPDMQKRWVRDAIELMLSQLKQNKML